MLNFLINTLNEEIDIGLGETPDIDSENIWDVLVGRRADEDSVSHKVTSQKQSIGVLCEVLKL